MTSGARQRMLDAAFDLILERGYPATSVDDVCAAAGVSKGSFYHHFGSKEEMALELLEQFWTESNRKLLGAPWSMLVDPEERLLGLLAYTEEMAAVFWGKGCLIGGLAMEVAATSGPLQQRLARVFDGLVERLAPAFVPAVVAGGPTADELAEQYLAAIEGAVVIAKAHRDPGRIVRGIRTFNDHVRRLLASVPPRS